MGSISIRKSIRWLPEAASEPTSTIVLTSPERRFVDLRILKGSDGPINDTSLERLDWAIAGTSSSQALPNGHVFSKWAHWIDSRFRNAEAASDEGDMVDLDDSTTLETGHMVNPDTGKDTPYEEIWADETPSHGPGGNVCVVLKHEDDAADSRGLVVQLSGYCQGFVRVGDAVALERWETDAGEMKRTVRLGDAEIHVPCKEATASSIALGAKVELGGRKWTVVEVVV